MTEPFDRDFEVLLAQASWVRALARHLTIDAHAADDVSQDALAAALARPAPAGIPLRQWLAGIVRNLARHERRSRRHRHERERAAARGEADSSSAHLLERLDVHRAVVEAVARLDEPYRDAVLMRYFEGLSPAAIASRTRTPPRTVHTRLHRALARLRADLDRTHGGDGKRWLLALVPFARGSSGGPAVGAGALWMDAKVKLWAAAAIAVAGVCSTIALWPSEEPASAHASLAAEPKSLDATAGPASLAESSPVEGRRAASASAEALPSAARVPPSAAPAFSGRVIDVDRGPVAGVRVRYVDRSHGPSDGVEATSAADGRFELAGLQGAGHVDVASAGWTNVLRPELDSAASASELVLVVARSVVVEGVVVDERGGPIDSAKIAVPLPLGLRARFDAILDRSNTIERSTQSDASGRFELADVPVIDGAPLLTTHARFVADERAVPAAGYRHLEIVLRSARAAGGHLAGTVVGPTGEPVGGAWVALGEKSTKSGADGAFSLDLSANAATTLRAAKRGLLPAAIELAPGDAWPDPLILRLSGNALSITGRVVDSSGEAISNARVWTDEETFFGYIAIEGGEMAMQAGATIEGLLRGDPWTRATVAAPNGRFALEGLLARDYRVHALDRRTLSVASATLDAGASNAEIRLPREPTHDRVAGRVTSLSGAPIAGVDVVLEREKAGIRSGEVERMESLPAKTDADGSFAFENVARAALKLTVYGDELETTGVDRAIGADDDVENLVIAVPMRVHAQVDTGAPSDFDQISVLDAEGEKLYLTIQHGESSYTMKELDLVTGRSEPFTVSEAGRTLVLYKAKREAKRVSIELERGALNSIRP